MSAFHSKPNIQPITKNFISNKDIPNKQNETYNQNLVLKYASSRNYNLMKLYQYLHILDCIKFTTISCSIQNSSYLGFAISTT